jgi:hypothetical protein
MLPRKKITLFLALTLGLSLLSAIPILAAGSLQAQGGIFTLTLMWAPGVAALITQFISRRSLRGLGWRFGAGRWLGLAYILPVLYALPVYLLVWLAGLGGFPNPELLEALTAQIPQAADASAIAIAIFGATPAWALCSAPCRPGRRDRLARPVVPELAKVTSCSRTALSAAASGPPGVPMIFADYNNASTPTWYAALCFAVLVIAISFLRLADAALRSWPDNLPHASQACSSIHLDA